MARFLLIGLDGAEPSLVEPWMDAGLLPNLDKLRKRGVYMRCASTTPPATFPAWTSCVTGVNPGKHGVFDFTRMHEGGYALEFVNSTSRRAPALWNILSDAHKRVGALGVPATYPPESVNGFMVSGFDSPVCTRIDRSFVQPPEYYDRVKDWRFADFQESDTSGDWHETALSKLLEGIEIKERAALDLYTSEPWDFFMAVFGESDTVSHHFWMFHDKNSPRHEPRFEDAILRVYRRLDDTVGKLIDAAGDDVTIGIVSDHGFGGAGTGVIHLNNWLCEKGHLSFMSGGDSLLKKLALRMVPGPWRGKLFRLFKGMAARAESASRFGGIDWNKTTAWSEELNYFPSVRLNLQGREPNGQVRQSDYEKVRAQLRDELKACEFVANAWTRDELYSGDETGKAPDIIIELALESGYSHSCLRGRGGPAFRRMGPEEYIGGKERGMNGAHRPHGVLFLSKPASSRFARLEDVAATVLAELDVAGPLMDGVSLLSPMKAAHKVIDGAHHETAYSSEEKASVEKRLRDLGYFE